MSQYCSMSMRLLLSVKLLPHMQTSPYIYWTSGTGYRNMHCQHCVGGIHALQLELNTPRDACCQNTTLSQHNAVSQHNTTLCHTPAPGSRQCPSTALCRCGCSCQSSCSLICTQPIRLLDLMPRLQQHALPATALRIQALPT
jgi:hypothetical protein